MYVCVCMSECKRDVKYVQGKQQPIYAQCNNTFNKFAYK